MNLEQERKESEYQSRIQRNQDQVEEVPTSQKKWDHLSLNKDKICHFLPFQYV